MSDSENSRDYADVVLVAPVTVPYTRYSLRTAESMSCLILPQVHLTIAESAEL